MRRPGPSLGPGCLLSNHPAKGDPVATGILVDDGGQAPVGLGLDGDDVRAVGYAEIGEPVLKLPWVEAGAPARISAAPPARTRPMTPVVCFFIGRDSLAQQLPWVISRRRSTGPSGCAMARRTGGSPRPPRPLPCSGRGPAPGSRTSSRRSSHGTPTPTPTSARPRRGRPGTRPQTTPGARATIVGDGSRDDRIAVRLHDEVAVRRQPLCAVGPRVDAHHPRVRLATAMVGMGSGRRVRRSLHACEQRYGSRRC